METDPPRILVVAMDADLRQEAFDRCTAEGYVVDGVADTQSARKRLAKDEYALLIVENEIGFDAGEVEGIPLLVVSADTPRDADGWRVGIREHLGPPPEQDA